MNQKGIKYIEDLISVSGIPPVLYRGKGCDKCLGSGFKGRQGVFELLMVDEQVRHLTVEQASSSVIRDHALKSQHMRTLLGDGKLAILHGKTTPEEVLRVCQREEL